MTSDLFNLIYTPAALDQAISQLLHQKEHSKLISFLQELLHPPYFSPRPGFFQYFAENTNATQASTDPLCFLDLKDTELLFLNMASNIAMKMNLSLFEIEGSIESICIPYLLMGMIHFCNNENMSVLRHPLIMFHHYSARSFLMYTPQLIHKPQKYFDMSYSSKIVTNNLFSLEDVARIGYEFLSDGIKYLQARPTKIPSEDHEIMDSLQLDIAAMAIYLKQFSTAENLLRLSNWNSSRPTYKSLLSQSRNEKVSRVLQMFKKLKVDRNDGTYWILALFDRNSAGKISFTKTFTEHQASFYHAIQVHSTLLSTSDLITTTNRYMTLAQSLWRKGLPSMLNIIPRHTFTFLQEKSLEKKSILSKLSKVNNVNRDDEQFEKSMVKFQEAVTILTYNSRFAFTDSEYEIQKRLDAYTISYESTKGPEKVKVNDQISSEKMLKNVLKSMADSSLFCDYTIALFSRPLPETIQQKLYSKVQKLSDADFLLQKRILQFFPALYAIKLQLEPLLSNNATDLTQLIPDHAQLQEAILAVQKVVFTATSNFISDMNETNMKSLMNLIEPILLGVPDNSLCPFALYLFLTMYNTLALPDRQIDLSFAAPQAISTASLWSYSNQTDTYKMPSIDENQLLLVIELLGETIIKKKVDEGMLTKTMFIVSSVQFLQGKYQFGYRNFLNVIIQESSYLSSLDNLSQVWDSQMVRRLVRYFEEIDVIPTALQYAQFVSKENRKHILISALKPAHFSTLMTWIYYIFDLSLCELLYEKMKEFPELEEKRKELIRYIKKLDFSPEERYKKTKKIIMAQLRLI